MYSAVSLWNSVPQSLRDSESITEFKNYLLRDIFCKPIVNQLYYLGGRYLSVLHTSLRLGHCGLNYYLFIINCKESPSCICGAPREDALYFLLLCPCFAAQRLLLLTSIERHANSVWKTLNLNKKCEMLLYGCPLVSFNDNVAIFSAVRKFIKNSNSFS